MRSTWRTTTGCAAVTDVAELYNAKGRYGRFNRRTLAVYAVSIIGTIPFMKLSFYTGFVASWLDADISWVVGLVLAGALYCMVNSPSSVRQGQFPSSVPE